MIGRLREALRGVSAFLSQRRERRRDSGEKEVIRGSAGNVIIVKSPNTEYFKEAIFILCDDLFTRRGVDRKQLIREARQAAVSYVSERVPQRESIFLRGLVPFLSGAFCCFIVLLLLGLLST